MFVFTLFVLQVSLIYFSECVDIHHTAGDFCYADTVCDPNSDKWGGICKTGDKQSPINIPATALLKYDPKHALYIETNHLYKELHQSFYMRNNGHTIQVQLEKKPTSRAFAYLTGIHLRGKRYAFAQMHFHWGVNDTMGSEHELDGENTAMEMHFVHYSEDYNSVEEAIKSNDSSALAVIAIFVKSLWNAMTSPSLLSIISHIPKKYQPEPVHVQKQMDLSSFFPSNHRDQLFMYEGSLTTPPCSQFVIWAVLLQPIYFHPRDIAQFRTIEDNEGFMLNQNFRPVQKRTNLDLPDDQNELMNERGWEDEYNDEGKNAEPEGLPETILDSPDAEPEAEPEDEFKFS